MARAPNENDSSRLYVRTSAEVAAYLGQLAEIGIHGTTRSEVAKTLIGYEIERLLREGVLQVRRGRGG